MHRLTHWILNGLYLLVLLGLGPWVAVRRLLGGKSLGSWPAKFMGTGW